MFYKKNKARKFIWSSILSLLILFSLFIFSNFVLASSSVGTEFIEGEIALSGADPRALATRIINISLSILGIVAVSIVIYGGFIWMTAEGNEEKIAKAKGILKAGVIGLAIVLASWGIASLVLRQLGDATGVSQTSCIDGETSVCGFEGVSTCQDGSWSSCVGSGGIPGGYGSSCSKPENPLACSSITLCNSGFVCGDSCTCEYEGQGDPCNEGASCGMGNNTCQENLFCEQSSCTCQPIDDNEEEYSELGDPCNDGGSCSAVDNSCNPNHGLSCSSDSCTCVGSPIITNISPRGGFCENLPETPCSNNNDCGGGLCNISTPNGALGNLITISGYNFDNNYVSGVSKVNLIYGEGGEEVVVTAQAPGELNTTCGNSWSNDQIIVAIPSGASFNIGDEVEIEVITGTNKVDRSRDENGPELDLLTINSIVRPGLCGVSNPGLEGLSEGKMNDELFYSGLNLNNSKAYFGNSVNNVVGFSPNNFTEDTQGLALVPGLSSGEVSTFAKKSLVFSNFVDFKKLPEPPQGPSISFFEPISGSSGQYITLYGSGFGNYKGISDIYFSANGVSILADYNFPAICLQSIWSDNQLLIKVPENIDDGEYNIVAKIGSWEEIVSAQTFSVDASASLQPSLCKISPTSGPHNSVVNLWGEYFGEEALAIFSVGKNSNNSEVLSENGADRIVVNISQESVSGPAKVSRNGLSGNSLNFSVGVCASNNDCPNTQICCGNNTSGAGTCVTNINDCDAGSPDNSVFEWRFTTGLSTSNPSYQGDEAYSCASYNFCPDNGYVCPNSPGTCSSYAGGQNYLTAGLCDETCNSVDYCDNTDENDSNNCFYDGENLDRCILENFNCSLGKNIEYNLGEGVGTTTKNAVCKNYNINNQSRNYFEISVNTSCPVINGVAWTMISPGKCVNTNQINSINDNSTCSLCPSASLTCQQTDLESENGVCVSSRLCQGDFTCLDGECQKEDPASCQCCCDKDNNDPVSGINSACCAPLTCGNSCGTSANSLDDDDNKYGLCSGCNVLGLDYSSSTNILDSDYSLNDSACNCLGTSGKYCEVNNTYPTGACLDCSALQLEETCRAHSSSCCWDSNNNSCRSGVSDTSVWGDVVNNIGMCPYYGCRSDNPTYCAPETPSPINTYPTIYSSLYLCDAGCEANCDQITSTTECSDTDKCCWDATLNSCKGGSSFDDGQCKYFACTDPGNNTCSETINSNNGNSNNFSNAGSCQAYCDSSPAGPNQYCSQTSPATGIPVCDSSVCNQFDCLNEEGELGGTSNNCGTCCCDPGAEVDKCGQINSSLTCLPNKGLCTGDNRGLCCGCSSDASCVGDTALPEFVGCGIDTCCKARPKIEENLSKNAGLNVFPEHKSEDICRNSAVEIIFDQRMDVASLQGNILLLEETSGLCSPGTYFIGQADLEQDNNWMPFKFIKNIFVKTFNSLAMVFGGTVLASPAVDKNYCSVLGTIDFEHLANNKTKVYFKPENLLKPSAKYFVVVKGDEHLNSSSGVKSSEGIGMNGLGYYTGNLLNDFNSLGVWLESSVNSSIKFNNIHYQNSYVWEFNTQDVSSLGQGICTIDYVTLTPSSYLFQSTSNDINENDQDSNNLSFDSVKDRDKVYSAKAYSADSQILQPTSQYDWTWEWSISNQNILVFYDDENNDGESDIVGFSLDGNKRLVGAKNGITDGQANVSVSTVLSSPYTTAGNNISRTVPAYVMICNNPWPAFDGETWEPWRDKEWIMINESIAQNVGQYNYEFYYCRDSGSQGTADDLPAFLSDRDVTRGNSLVRVCSNAPSQTCSVSSDCPSGGLCLASFLKETYFFKERIPHFIENVSAQDNGTGGSLKISWESEKALVDRYKIYYSFSNNSNQQEKIVNPEIECSDTSDPTKYSCQINLNNLSNNQQYAVRVTAISENLAETNFSAVAFGTPTESGLEQQDLNVPLNLQAEVLSTTSRTVKLTWEAPAGYSVSSYKVYRGVSSLNYGASFLTNNSDTEITINLSSAPNDIYYLAISSIGLTSVESDKSNEVMINLVDGTTSSLGYNPCIGFSVCGNSCLYNGVTYNTVQVGNQCWFKENLRTTAYRDGSNIFYPGTNNNAWSYDTSGAYACWGNSMANCTIYGALYNWYAVNNSNGLCPSGWHVPTNDDYTDLERQVCLLGGNNEVTCFSRFPKDDSSEGLFGVDEGTKLKSSSWDGTDNYGFNMIRSGYRHESNGAYYSNIWAFHWTATDAGSTAWRRLFGAGTPNVQRTKNAPKARGNSVRCVKN